LLPLTNFVQQAVVAVRDLRRSMDALSDQSWSEHRLSQEQLAASRTLVRAVQTRLRPPRVDAWQSPDTIS